MDEDRLTPQMGRLIDAAKSAAARGVQGFVRAEGVALLAEDGSVHVGCAGIASEHGVLPAAKGVESSAADMALASARESGQLKILAAAVAGAGSCGDTVLPSSQTVRALAAVSSELPLVLKRHGRWVLSALSEFAVEE